MSPVWLQSLFSDGSAFFVRPASPKLHKTVRIRLRLLRDNPLQKLFLRTAPEGEEILTPMRLISEDDLLQTWQARVCMEVPLLKYRFVLRSADRQWHYNQQGVYEFEPDDGADFRLIADYEPPAWLRGRVFYQIFPDRFRNGDASLNPRGNEYSYEGFSVRFRPWGSPPLAWKTSGNLDFYGGDLAGIEAALPYLRELGVNAVYLNPVFQAPSNHKYDTQDYYRIDSHFGGNEQFAGLLQTFHSKGFKVILDGVFNHTGVLCHWYQEARRNPGSSFADCYYWHGGHAHSWRGVSTLPTLNYHSSLTRDLIYRGPDAVATFWLKPPYQADGWRLDVANMLGRYGADQPYLTVWREFRAAVKQARPDAYLMGEHFFDASDLLQGDMLDASMNYIGFTKPAREWLSGRGLTDGHPLRRDAARMQAQMRAAQSRLPWQIAQQQYNLLNGHDIQRLSGILPDARQNRLAAMLLLTWQGVPSLYYGEEIGLVGRGKNPDLDRLCMEWNPARWDQDLLAFYRRLIALRKTSPALQNGSQQVLLAEGDVYAYVRFNAEQCFLVVLNNGDTKTVTIPVYLAGLSDAVFWRDMLRENTFVTEKGIATFIMDAYCGLVLRAIVE